LKAILDIPEEPTSENTIVAHAHSGGILARVRGVCSALTESDPCDPPTALLAPMGPVLSDRSAAIYAHQDSYSRVADVHLREPGGRMTLTTERHREPD